MDDKNKNNNVNISIFNSKSSSNSNQISSLVLDHLLSSSSPLSSALITAATSVGSSHVGNVAHLTKRPVSMPPSLADVPVGFDPAILVHGSSRRKTPEADIDSYDCESEEGVDVVEEPVKPSGHRSSSGSKRSRAAEVHNLSEKRRRSRINEKMKALQSLIPNSNKTDKASMLDEAIEYLKQLQLQVQMLSMRNGLSLSPTFLPGDIPAHQASEMRLGFGVDNGPLMNLGMSMRPVSQDSLIQDSLRLPNQCSSSLRSHTPCVSDIKDPMLTFAMESSLPQQSHVQHGSFNLSAIAGNEPMAPHPQLGAFNMTRPGMPSQKNHK